MFQIAADGSIVQAITKFVSEWEDFCAAKECESVMLYHPATFINSPPPFLIFTVQSDCTVDVTPPPVIQIADKL
jgi:hypothetical protein